MIYIVIPTTPERRGRLQELLDSIYKHTDGIQHSIVIYENNDGGWVPAVRNAIKDIHGYVALLSSDTVVEKDWLVNLWNAFIKAFPDGSGVAEPYNELHNDTLCQHPLAHADTIRKYLHPDFIHWYSDCYFTDLAKRDGKLIYVPEARIEHKHFMNGKAPKDKTYETIFDQATIKKDQETYERLKKEFHGK